jgi:hypothetical protein
MSESFLILLSAGIMLAAAISDPQQVTLLWLRLCGILALSMAGLAVFFLFRAEQSPTPPILAAFIAAGMSIVGQVAFTQVAWRRSQQVFAWLAFFFAVSAGQQLIRAALIQAGVRHFRFVPYVSAIGIAAMAGLALMDMLLGHAYLTASKMTMAPFRRLNGALAGTLIWRTLAAVPLVLFLQHLRPIYLFWGQHGLFILTRWLVGLAVPAIFIYMAHDCITRRATQSATGILYVAGVLIFIGEIVALYLVRATGLPF